MINYISTFIQIVPFNQKKTLIQVGLFQINQRSMNILRKSLPCFAIHNYNNFDRCYLHKVHSVSGEYLKVF